MSRLCASGGDVMSGMWDAFDVATCRVCGCTEGQWVPDPEGDLCSACATGAWRRTDGTDIRVEKGLGESYMTFLAGSRHRIKSPKLPPRDTFEEAQADLDDYAMSKGYTRVVRSR